MEGAEVWFTRLISKVGWHSSMRETYVIGHILLRRIPPTSEDLPYKQLSDGYLDGPGVAWREKQLLPAVLALLEG